MKIKAVQVKNYRKILDAVINMEDSITVIDVRPGADFPAGLTQAVKQFFKVLWLLREYCVDVSSQDVSVRCRLFLAEPLVVGRVCVAARVLYHG